MNQNELNELKRCFKPGNPWLSLGSVLTAYVKITGIEKETAFVKVRPFEDFSPEEQDIHLKMLKKVLSSKLGKNGRIYKFTDDEKGKEAQKQFYALRQSRLSEQEQIDWFLEHIKEHAGYEESFYCTLMFCDFLVPAKDKNREVLAEADRGRVPFIVCAFNPVTLTSIGLVFDPASGEVIRKHNEEMQVKDKVLDGFMYPAITDGAGDISRILYYSSKPKDPNGTMCEDLFSAQFELSMNEEADAFHNIVETIYDGELGFQTVGRLQETLHDMLENKEDEEEEIRLDGADLRDLMENAGTSEKALAKLDSAVLVNLNDQSIYAANAMNTNKIDINAGGIKISAPFGEKDRIKSEKRDGRFCLTVELNGQLTYNGFEVIPAEKKDGES
ncbi:MAG: DUF4317 family protein [Erysipelotrichaceae bacterium]|nr:DUF4317 family protein [Erysipelotrichaceae bacterium]